MIKQQESQIKDLQHQIEVAELKVENAELSVNRLQYEFDSYKEDVKKQIKKHKMQKIWWGLIGVGVGFAIGRCS